MARYEFVVSLNSLGSSLSLINRNVSVRRRQNNYRHRSLIRNALLSNSTPGALRIPFADQCIPDLRIPLGIFVIAGLHHRLDRVVVGVIVVVRVPGDDAG